jgi:hypothetical protein
LRADTETIDKDLSIRASLNAANTVPLSFIWTLADQIQRVPNSTASASYASSSIPIGVGRANDTLSTVPVSSSADTIVKLIIPESAWTWTYSTIEAIPEGVVRA